MSVKHISYYVKLLKIKVKMKTRIIVLTSYWDDHKLRLRISAKKATELFKYDDPMEMLNIDCYKSFVGYSTTFISTFQVKKICSFFNKGCPNYFIKVELL